MRADGPALQPLMRAYDSGLEARLAAAEREALPWRIARQPLRAIGARWHRYTTRTPPGHMPAPGSPQSSATQQS